MASAVGFVELSSNLAPTADRDGGRLIEEVVQNLGTLTLAQRHALAQTLLGISEAPVAVGGGTVVEQCGAEHIGGRGADT
jgi:hypothetical protein